MQIIVWHRLNLVAALAGSVTLQPGEVAAGVDVEEVGPRRVADAHRHIVQSAQQQEQKEKKIGLGLRFIIDASKGRTQKSTPK